jgi:hypothetical protein
MSGCGCKALVARGDPKGPSASVAGIGRLSKRPSKAKPHCVVAKKSGRVVGCFASKASAQKVARGFGPGFELRRSQPRR